jgi:hypothetical protein
LFGTLLFTIGVSLQFQHNRDSIVLILSDFFEAIHEAFLLFLVEALFLSSAISARHAGSGFNLSIHSASGLQGY